MNRRCVTLGAAALVVVSMLGIPRASYAQSDSAEANSAAIRQVVAQFMDAFNRHNAQDWASFFLEDGDFTNVYGLSLHGSKAVEERFVKLFSGPLKEAHRTATVRHIRFIKSDVAAVDATWELVGSKAENGSDNPVRTGMFTWVMVERDGRWRFAVAYEFEFKSRQ
jgi:uncharacterized protein (TIGR02246 family)